MHHFPISRSKNRGSPYHHTPSNAVGTMSGRFQAGGRVLKRCCKNCHWLHSHSDITPSYPLNNLEFWMSDHVESWTLEQREKSSLNELSDSVLMRKSSCFMKEWGGKVFSGTEADRKFLEAKRKGCRFMKYDQNQSKMVDAYFRYTDKQEMKESRTNRRLHFVGILLSFIGVTQGILSYLFR